MRLIYFEAVNDMFDSSDNLIIGVTLQGDWQSEEVLIDGVHKIGLRNGNYIYVFYHLHNDPNNENKYDYIKIGAITDHSLKEGKILFIKRR